MKVVIIGGGIAGLTAGILFDAMNFEVVVNERHQGIEAKGHAFLMNEDGLAILEPFFKIFNHALNRKRVDLFSLKRPDGEELIKIKLDPWYCIKRIDLISFLVDVFPKEKIKGGRVFSHFIYENEKAIAAVFMNGEIEYGDLFIGADGSNSKVRQQLFGPTNFTPIDIKEIVGVSKTFIPLVDNKAVFQKFQDHSKGLSFGYIPTYNNELVWFMQYDVNLVKQIPTGETDLKTFCYAMLNHFPHEVKKVLEGNDFSTSYIWNTRDFDLLPSFHKNNICIIGDAAHLALPFTSAGTTNALLDAQTLVNCFKENSNFKEAFENYYLKRAENLEKHVFQGREIKKLFLQPRTYSERDFLLPLISNTDSVPQIINKPIKITYFTDPVCSTCWVIQPILRKLKLEYDHVIDIDYRMGGMIPSWINFKRGEIEQPIDAAKHWDEVSALHKMPIDGDIWIEDPLESSYPPSIAFKAAQLQSKDKAILFLRRIKEMVFLEKKNITKKEFIENAALSCGLDAAVLLKDIETKALQLFIEDLNLAKANEVTSFPTLLFSKKTDVVVSLKGIQPYSKFEEIIQEIVPEVTKKAKPDDPVHLFKMFNLMTESEFSFLSDYSLEESSVIIQQLYSEGKIEKEENKNGIVWKYIMN